jgi:hypothetical protein
MLAASNFAELQTSNNPFVVITNPGSGGGYARPEARMLPEMIWAGLGIVIGTGGIPKAYSYAYPTGTRAVIFAIEPGSSQPEGKTTSDSLLEIKSAFGLGIKQLAEILLVTRQIVYRWLDTDNPMGLQSRNRERLNAMYALAQTWLRLSGKPLGKHGDTIRLASKKTLLDLLRQDPLDSSLVIRAMIPLSQRIEKLGPKQGRPKKSVYDAMVARGFRPAKARRRTRTSHIRTVSSDPESE